MISFFITLVFKIFQMNVISIAIAVNKLLLYIFSLTSLIDKGVYFSLEIPMFTDNVKNKNSN